MKRSDFVFAIFLFTGLFVHAESNPSTDPNTMPLDKWDIAIKDPANVNEVLQAKWNSLVNVLKDSTLDKPVKVILVDRIITPIFDFQLMGKLALGKTNWPKLTPPQQDTFQSLFSSRLKAAYRDKIMMYDDQKTELLPAVIDKDKAQIQTTLISSDKKFSILYKLRKADKSWKIYDVEIEGVSILLTYRAQFDDILSRGTAQDLLKQLETPAGS